MRHYNYYGFASAIHHSFKSEQSLIGTELEDGEENQPIKNDTILAHTVDVVNSGATLRLKVITHPSYSKQQQQQRDLWH